MGNYFGVDVYDLESYTKHRAECVKTKLGAINVQFDEFDGLISDSKFSEMFLERTPSWFTKRLHSIPGKNPSFTEEECKLIAEGYRAIAKQLEIYADEIDKAEYRDY